jgi:putative phosphoribosyl transferase
MRKSTTYSLAREGALMPPSDQTDPRELPYGDDHLERTISIRANQVMLNGTLGVPASASGVVLFAHGSGSSRFSPRNRFVARVLREAGLATLLLDLLSRAEEEIDEITRQYRFDIQMLADRLDIAIDWLTAQPETESLSVGLFGASTGGGAALVAAADRPVQVGAVVSRGGRPDLAGDSLPLVQAPTLLLVGERDEQVIELNERARARMHANVSLEIVPGATHLFEEPGALEQVAARARDWFVQHSSEQAHAHARTEPDTSNDRSRS